MSGPKKPIASVVRPGRAPEGPPGWEEKRIEKEQAATERTKEENERPPSTGLQGIKDKIHHLGEKMHLVVPKNPEDQTAAQQQVSTEFQPSSEQPDLADIFL